MLRLIAFLLCLSCLPATAAQDPLPVRKAIEAFLHVQTKGLPGQAS